MARKKEDWFTNIAGASKILNRTTTTVGSYVKHGRVQSIRFGTHKLISMSDIATVMGTSESTVVKVAKAKSIPLWKCK